MESSTSTGAQPEGGANHKFERIGMQEVGVMIQMMLQSTVARTHTLLARTTHVARTHTDA